MMTTHDQKVVKSGQTQGFIEKSTSDLLIDGKLSQKFICVIFKNVSLLLLITTHDLKVVTRGQTQGFIEKMDFQPINRKFKDTVRTKSKF